MLASSMAADRVILMHQGGWDELLIALGPLVVIAVLVIAARRNVPTEPVEDAEDEDRGYHETSS